MSCLSHCSQHQAVFMFGKCPKEAYNLECLVPTVEHGSGSVMIWAAISWYSAGPIITLNG